MDEIYQKISKFNPQRIKDTLSVTEFDVTELWRKHATDTIEARDKTVNVKDVEAWLAEETRSTESLVLRLVWATIDFEKKLVNLPTAARNAILNQFGLQLAYGYLSSWLAGISTFPEVHGASADQESYAFTYAPKLAAVWSHSRFRPPATRASATHGLVLAGDTQRKALKELIHSGWQPGLCSHAMFPAFLFSFMLGGEIDMTQGIITKYVQTVEKRTGYQTFKTERKVTALEQLGVLSARMSGHAVKLASAERKSKTLGQLMEFVQNTLEASSSQVNPEGNKLMKNHITVLQDRLGLQALETKYTLRRVQIQIGALVNLIAQEDSINNFDIALSSHRDASSMKTLAVVTMFFLPGSFISALFSTSCFDWDDANKQGSNISVRTTPQFGLYWAITVPLTIVTFILYFMWLWWQTTKREQQSQEAKKQAAQQAEVPAEVDRLNKKRRDTYITEKETA
ncbi:hypothetical protein G7046_g7443 [Stylonectria norvegica]|nr:hypothetical protein G7046_g7443 [Stylonectria norvegica]